MRLNSDFWVAGLVRRVFSAGGFAAVLRKGSPGAGSVFVKARATGGTAALYGPAPQTFYGEANPGERLFSLLLAEADDEVIDARLEREAKFDNDLWVVEIEVPQELLAGLIPATTL